MRCILLLLSLSAGSMAFGQAGPTLPYSAGHPNQASPSLTWQGGSFANPPRWDALRVLPQTVIEIPPPKSGVLLGDARIDPRMIVRPLPSQLGALPEGQLVARNLYPGLRFQPIDGPLWGPSVRPWCGPNPGPLATKWPRLRIEEIPTVWPGLRMEAVGSKGNSVP